MSKGIKPLNTKVMDGGASWKDRYEVKDDLAQHIQHCLTLSTGDREAVIVIVIGGDDAIRPLFNGIDEKFPVGSIAFLKDEEYFNIFLKLDNITWNNLIPVY